MVMVGVELRLLGRRRLSMSLRFRLAGEILAVMKIKIMIVILTLTTRLSLSTDTDGAQQVTDEKVEGLVLIQALVGRHRFTAK